MTAVPFRCFEGGLKQLQLDALGSDERQLLDLLFPGFLNQTPSMPRFADELSDGLFQAASPLIQLAPPHFLRRFANFDFPRGGYSVLSSSGVTTSGPDQTLAHELRAYRDPIGTGLVEVLDLAVPINLVADDEIVTLQREDALALLVHEPERIRGLPANVPFSTLPRCHGRFPRLYRIPVSVSAERIHGTIDLRYPEVQQWFFQTFRDPSAIDGVAISDVRRYGVDDSHLIRSMHWRERASPPTPRTFFEMLPTLVNPELGGGGEPAIAMVANWMMAHGVSALIFPSARSDVFALFQKGELIAFGGWNLVDYRKRDPRAPHMSTILMANPWSWVEMPPGVKLSIADPTSELAGTFMVEGLLAGTAEDYLERVEAGRDHAGGQVSRSASLFRLGLASLAWVTAVVEESSVEAGRPKIVELRKLGLSFGVTREVEAIVESWRGVSRGTAAFPSVLARTLVLSEDLGAAISSAEGVRAATSMMLGRALEQLRLFLQISAITQRGGLAIPLRPELLELQRQFFASGDLRTLLGDDAAAAAQAFSSEAAACLVTPDRHHASLLRRANDLTQHLLRLLERGRDEST